MDNTDEDGIPYFMWDERLSAGRIRNELSTAPKPRRIELMAKIMRDARLEDVWKFMTISDIVEHRDELFARLGWHKGLWVFLYNRWIDNGLLEAEKYTDTGPGRIS